MKMMKRYVFIIGLWAACFALPNVLKAQWEFYYICGISDLYKQGGYPTKSACETAARAMKGQQCRGANIYGNKIIIASEADPCRGKDLPIPGSNNDGGFSDKFGNINITGTNQGKAFHSNSPYEELPALYKQKNLQNEIHLGKRNVGSVKYGGNEMPLTDDKNYNKKVSMVSKWRNFHFLNSSRQQENNSTYVSQGTYKGTLQDLMAKPAGLNVSNYFSEEEWNKCSDSRTLASDACTGFKEQYNRFLHDVSEYHKKQDPLFVGNVVDEAWASTKEQLKEDAIIRAQGAMQALGGAFDVVSGYTIATGGEIFAPGVAGAIGTVVAIDGVDNFQTGMRQLLTGTEKKTVANAIESRIGLPQNVFSNVVNITDIGASSVHRISKSVFKPAKSSINATVVPRNPATETKIRNLSSNKGGKIISKNVASQAKKTMAMQPLSPIRQSIKQTKDITSFKNETGITLKEAIDTRIAENARIVQTAANKDGVINYPNADNWIASRIPKGTIIYNALPGGENLGNFYAIINDNINTVQLYRNRLQVMLPDATKGFTERTIIGVYIVDKDIDVAVSKALANSQYGQGGGWQLYLETNDAKRNIRLVNRKILQNEK
jgi:hypothetical protein